MGSEAIWFGNAYTNEEKRVASTHLQRQGKREVVCAHCGQALASHKATVVAHQQSQHCATARQRFAEASAAAAKAVRTNIAGVITQYTALLAAYRNQLSPCYLTPERKEDPHKFWLAVRPHFPLLATVMLFWLAHPVGTCGLERDFSGVTMVTRSTRRRRMKFDSFRTCVLAHCYKGDLKAKLRALVRTV